MTPTAGCSFGYLTHNQDTHQQYKHQFSHLVRHWENEQTFGTLLYSEVWKPVFKREQLKLALLRTMSFLPFRNSSKVIISMKSNRVTKSNSVTKSNFITKSNFVTKSNFASKSNLAQKVISPQKVNLSQIVTFLIPKCNIFTNCNFSFTKCNIFTNRNFFLKIQIL